MDAAALGNAMALLGRFNDEMTGAFDAAMGSQWAEIEEILTVAILATDHAVTTRRLAELTGMNRRAISRMVARLQSAGLITTRRSASDGRAVDIIATEVGERRIEALRRSIDGFFQQSISIAVAIRDGLGPPPTTSPATAADDPMDLLRRVCDAGLALVHSLPEATTQGRLAARQRAALVHIVSVAGVRPHDLTDSLGVSRAGVAYIVDQLCAKGYVVRHHGTVPEDARAVVLAPTADGARVVQAVMEAIHRQRGALAEVFSEVALRR